MLWPFGKKARARRAAEWYGRAMNARQLGDWAEFNRACERGRLADPPKEPPLNSDFFPFMKEALRPDVATVLDLGCGRLWEEFPTKEDYLLSVFSEAKFKVTGVDASEHCVEWRRKNGPHGTYLAKDVCEAARSIQQPFDLVIAHHVIEHLEKTKGLQLLEDIERIAARQVIIGSPVGFSNNQTSVDRRQNEFERHLSGWLPEEFVERGYRVLRIYRGAFLVSKDMRPPVFLSGEEK